jgi:hypothetical protein
LRPEPPLSTPTSDLGGPSIPILGSASALLRHGSKWLEFRRILRGFRMGKMVVLKPVVWSPNGYKFPAGLEKSGPNYVATNGFGHEEWNGDPDRVWGGERIFHTEVKGQMETYGSRGDLGIIMTAYAPRGPSVAGGPCAVGIATSVRLNTKPEQVAIAEAVGTRAQVDNLWALQSIQKRFKDFRRFEKFWAIESLEGIPWRCPIHHYEMFSAPIRLDPRRLFPPTVAAPKSPEIIKRFSYYMSITPEQALSVVQGSLDEESPILKWLTTGTFDDKPIAKKTKSYGRPKLQSGSKGNGSASSADGPYVRYLQAQEITVTSKHGEIQDSFASYVTSLGAKGIGHDQAGVDVQFTLPDRGLVLAEVKPCDESSARFAIRTAMGQLLDYQQKHKGSPKHLLVVLEVKPNAEDFALAIKNGFGIAYPWRSKFILKWPY